MRPLRLSSTLPKASQKSMGLLESKTGRTRELQPEGAKSTLAAVLIMKHGIIQPATLLPSLIFPAKPASTKKTLAEAAGQAEAASAEPTVKLLKGQRS